MKQKKCFAGIFIFAATFFDFRRILKQRTAQVKAAAWKRNGKQEAKTGGEGLEQELQWVHKIVRHGSRKAADALVRAYYDDIYA